MYHILPIRTLDFGAFVARIARTEAEVMLPMIAAAPATCRIEVLMATE
jgi:hypothetical protein